MRVRIAFAACTALLLVGTWALLDSALERLERERQLRHDVVAERMFDELERELSAHLERESARPSVAYEASSDVATWAPFVLGYFTVDDGYHLVSRDQLSAERAQRLESTLASVWPNPATPQQAPVAQVPEPGKTLRSKRKALDNADDVLRRLNRAQDVRQQKPVSKQDPFAY